MMISAGTAELALSIAQTIFKLAGRIDRLYAAQEATRSPLALPNSVKINPPDVDVMSEDLREFLASNPEGDGEPLGKDRAKIQELLNDPTATAVKFVPWMEIYVPDKLVLAVDDPDKKAAELLQSFQDAGLLTSLDATERDKLLFYLGPGADYRERSLPWQLATVVLDALADIGFTYQNQLGGSEKTRRIVSAVLTRFASPGLMQVSSGKTLLQHVIRATLNGALDSQQDIDVDNPWLDAALGALSEAREAMPETRRDDFLLGLVQGRGYRNFVSELIEEGAERLGNAGAEAYKKIIADLLLEASEQLSEAAGNAELNFQDQWTDLARAGLRSLASHGPALLDEATPILREVLLGVVGSLAAEDERNPFSSDSLTAATEAAIAAVAAKPELLGDDKFGDWLGEFIGSFAKVTGEQGLREALSHEGLESIAFELATRLAEHPELIIDRPGLVQEMIGNILGGLATSRGLPISEIASAVVDSVLTAVAENPGLLDSKYGDVLADFAPVLADRIREGSLTTLQARELLIVVITSVAANPELFLELQNQLARQIVIVVLERAQMDPQGLLTGTALVEVVESVLRTVSMRGGLLLDGGSASTLAERVGIVMNVALEAAAKELGRQLDRDSVPTVVADLVDSWARGRIPKLLLDDPTFKKVFAASAENATRRLQL